MATITLPAAIPAGKTSVTIQVAGMLGYGNCAYLNSTAGGRAIQFSPDGGVTFFTPATYDGNITAALALFMSGMVTHLEFTGAAGDTFGIAGLVDVPLNFTSA